MSARSRWLCIRQTYDRVGRREAARAVAPHSTCQHTEPGGHMEPDTTNAQRGVMVCAVGGMTAVFIGIALLVHTIGGMPWSSAAGVAAVPTLFAGWYFGSLL